MIVAWPTVVAVGVIRVQIYFEGRDRQDFLIAWIWNVGKKS